MKKLPVFVAIVALAMLAVSRIAGDPRVGKQLMASLKAKVPESMPIVG